MKLNYSLLLTACVLLVLLAGFFYFHKTCAELANRHELLSSRQLESTKITHLPKLIQASDEFQGLLTRQNQLQDEIEYLRQQIDLLLEEKESITKIEVDTLRPTATQADICRQEQMMRGKILKKLNKD